MDSTWDSRVSIVVGATFCGMLQLNVHNTLLRSNEMLLRSGINSCYHKVAITYYYASIPALSKRPPSACAGNPGATVSGDGLTLPRWPQVSLTNIWNSLNWPQTRPNRPIVVFLGHLFIYRLDPPWPVSPLRPLATRPLPWLTIPDHLLSGQVGATSTLRGKYLFTRLFNVNKHPDKHVRSSLLRYVAVIVR